MCGCAGFCRADRSGAGLRSGARYIEDIAADGRQVYIDGRMVEDVTTHPAFSGAVGSVARLFDIAREPRNGSLMTYSSPATGVPVNRIWQLPRSREDLVARREAIQKWSDTTFGFMGRTPDHVAGFYAGFMMAPEVFARDRPEFAEHLARFYEFLRDHDLYVTYTIVPPQIDRSKPAHQQDEPDLYAGIVEERSDGIVIRGAQMLGTGTALSDFVHLSTIHPMPMPNLNSGAITNGTNQANNDAAQAWRSIPTSRGRPKPSATTNRPRPAHPMAATAISK